MAVMNHAPHHLQPRGLAFVTCRITKQGLGLACTKTLLITVTQHTGQAAARQSRQLVGISEDQMVVGRIPKTGEYAMGRLCF